MATKRKKNKKIGRGGKIALCAFAAVLFLTGVLAGIGTINAGVVRIRRAEVMLPDLPPAFDGVSVLYASDIDLFGLNTPAKSGALFESLQSLEPDILLLGGDYTADSLLKILNRPEGTDESASKRTGARSDFFHYIASFDAPLGKFAIAAPEDADWDGLRDQLREANIRPLINERTEVRRGSDVIYLAGVCEESASLNSAGSTFTRGDCVLVAAYSPAVLPILLTSEASDGGQWADLLLCGHTHGGQIRLFGRSALPLTSREQRYLSGWHTDSGLPILITQGVGCEGVNMRLGTQPEVWLLTLKCT